MGAMHGGGIPPSLSAKERIRMPSEDLQAVQQTTRSKTKRNTHTQQVNVGMRMRGVRPATGNHQHGRIPIL